MQNIIVDELEQVLAKLDAAGFSLAAVHVSTALDSLRAELDERNETGSQSDSK